MPSSRQRATSSGWPADVSITIAARSFAGPLADASGQVEAVHLRHVGVEQHQRERLAGGGRLPEGRQRRRAAVHRQRPSSPSCAAPPRGCGGWWRCHRPRARGRPCSSAGCAAGGRVTGPFARPKRAVKWKVLPWPTSLSTQMRPPIIWTSCEQIARPRPVPPYLRVVEASAWAKASKISRCFSAGMPMPVSLTSKCRVTK